MKKKEEYKKVRKGDTILVGKFKNKKVVATGFGIDKNNQPTILTKKEMDSKGKAVEKPLYNFRIKRLMEEGVMQDFDKFFEDAVSSGSFQTNSGSGGSGAGENTPSNYIGTAENAKKKKKKFLLKKMQGNKDPETIADERMKKV